MNRNAGADQKDSMDHLNLCLNAGDTMYMPHFIEQLINIVHRDVNAYVEEVQESSPNPTNRENYSRRVEFQQDRGPTYWISHPLGVPQPKPRKQRVNQQPTYYGAPWNDSGIWYFPRLEISGKFC